MLLMTAITVVYPIILQMTIDEVILGGKYGLVIWISLGFIAVMAAKGAATFSSVSRRYVRNSLCLPVKKRAVCEIAASAVQILRQR